MISPEKLKLLQSFLGTLPENIATRLACAVEVDRLMDGTALPHDLILEGLRPMLRRTERRTRTPSAIRLFSRPFEDLLISTNAKPKQKGRIARASLTPVWTWVSESLMQQTANKFIADLRPLILSRRFDDALKLAKPVWTEASQAIRQTLSSESGRQMARIALKSDATIADAAEMALLLGIGSDVLELQSLLPKPVWGFEDKLVWRVRAVYDRVVVDLPDAAPYIAVIVMQRLARPWEALRLPMQIARQHHDTLISHTDMGLSGELLFSDIDTYSAAIRTTHHSSFEVDQLIENIARFAELSSAVVKELEIRRDGKWGQALLKDRAEVAEVMDNLMERAPKEIAGALPTQKSGSYGKVRFPDFSRPVDPLKIERALKYARLISGSRPFAAAASFGATLKDAQDKVVENLRRYCDELVQELRTAEGPRREIVDSQYELAVQLTTLLISEKEAELLRRRARAAHANAA
jgi:hypothetical protein